MNHFMIDIETLGNSPQSVITQIACVRFDPMSDAVSDQRFVVNVDPLSCEKVGLKCDASTVLFWMKQSKEAQSFMIDSVRRSLLPSALMDLFDYLKQVDACDRIIWANSPSFDLVILKEVVKLCFKTEQWSDFPCKYYNERDVRTISSLFPEIKDNHVYSGIKHDGISDCLNQIAIVQKCYRAIYKIVG